MIVYFADRYMNILQKASTGLPKGFHIINDVKTEEVDAGVAVFEFDLKYDGEDRLQAREITKPGNYLLRHYDDEDEYYTIIDTEEDTSSNTIYVYAEDAGLDLLSDTYGEYTADKAYPISYYIFAPVPKSANLVSGWGWTKLSAIPFWCCIRLQYRWKAGFPLPILF